MNPKQFLLWGGIILLVVGILGYIKSDFLGFLGFEFDSGENFAHTLLGIVALAAYLWLPAMAQKWLVVLVGLLGLYFTVAGYLVRDDASGMNYFGLANLENPADNLLHLVVGLWALWAGFKSET